MPNVIEVRPRRGGTTVCNIRFRNVRCIEAPAVQCHIGGLPGAPVRSIAFEDYYILGKLVTDAASGKIIIGPNTSGVTFGGK